MKPYYKSLLALLAATSLSLAEETTKTGSGYSIFQSPLSITSLVKTDTNPDSLEFGVEERKINLFKISTPPEVREKIIQSKLTLDSVLPGETEKTFRGLLQEIMANPEAFRVHLELAAPYLNIVKAIAENETSELTDRDSLIKIFNEIQPGVWGILWQLKEPVKGYNRLQFRPAEELQAGAEQFAELRTIIESKNNPITLLMLIREELGRIIEDIPSENPIKLQELSNDNGMEFDLETIDPVEKITQEIQESAYSLDQFIPHSQRQTFRSLLRDLALTPDAAEIEMRKILQLTDTDVQLLSQLSAKDAPPALDWGSLPAFKGKIDSSVAKIIQLQKILATEHNELEFSPVPVSRKQSLLRYEISTYRDNIIALLMLKAEVEELIKQHSAQ